MHQALLEILIGRSGAITSGGGFFGGGSSAPAEAAPQQSAAASSEYQAPKVCENDINSFKQCMDQNEGSLTICGWYLEQLVRLSPTPKTSSGRGRMMRKDLFTDAFTESLPAGRRPLLRAGYW